MKLYFMRHGDAETEAEDGTDFSRRLTEPGIAEVARIGRSFRRHDLRVDTILCSPLIRAGETAAIMARELGLSDNSLAVCDEIGSGRLSLGSLQRILAGARQDARIMLVGHEPDLSTVVFRLTGGRIEMKKSSVAYIETSGIAPDAGILRWLMPARFLTDPPSGEISV